MLQQFGTLLVRNSYSKGFTGKRVLQRWTRGKKVVLVLLGHLGEASSHLNVVAVYRMATEWCWRDSSLQPKFGSILFGPNLLSASPQAYVVSACFRSISMIFFLAS